MKIIKAALITGITGQDGAYLAELLLNKGYTVWGMKRRSSTFNTSRIDNLFARDRQEENPRFHYFYGDLTDSSNITRYIQEIQPDEIYNLAAMSHVRVSFDTPEYTANADGLGTLRVLDAVKTLKLTEKTRIYQASTSELFGNSSETPQNENTPLYPRSPYGAAKLYAYWITVNYREAYDMYACNGILFNHESPIRGETFVTRKITRAVANIGLGKQNILSLGNLNATRDWGHAKDYVRAMYLMLQQDYPDDYVIATGKAISVREFVATAFNFIGIKLEFMGKGKDEVGIISEIDHHCFVDRMGMEMNHLRVGQKLIVIDPFYFRPTEIDNLIGDPRKAKQQLGWKPEYTLDMLVQDMVEGDIKLMKREEHLRNGGFSILPQVEEIR